MVSVRAPVGDSNFADQRIAIGRGLAVIRARPVTTNAYLRLVIQHSTAALLARSGTGMFSSITGTQLRTFQFRLPPHQEQRRIVDVMAAVDTLIEALESERQTLAALLNEALGEAIGSLEGPHRAIEGLCAVVIGGIWGKPPGEGEVDVLALGPRIYAPGTSGFVTDGSPLRSFSKAQVEKRTVQDGDIILERSGGSPDQPVGRVVIAGPGLEPCVPTDFQRLLRPDPLIVNARFLYWCLRHDWTQGVTRQYSRRTTGITNLSVKDYLARSIVVPDLDRQQSVVALADAIDERLDSATPELAALRRYRSTLLAALVAGETALPDSYDELLKVAS